MKKQDVVDKLKTFFEKFFGIGGSIAFKGQEREAMVYNINSQDSLLMAAESPSPYGSDNK